MHRGVLLMVLVGVLALASCSDSKVSVAGKVMADGKAVDVGTIHFQSADGSSMHSAGGTISGGQIQLPPKRRLDPGLYRVQVQAYSKTGRKISDPQRGEIDEMVPLAINGLPLKVEVTAENSADLLIELSSAGSGKP